jgi:hypothetical protein
VPFTQYDSSKYSTKNTSFAGYEITTMYDEVRIKITNRVDKDRTSLLEAGTHVGGECHVSSKLE